MKGVRLLLVLVLLICLGLGYFVYITNNQIIALREDNAALYCKLDTLQMQLQAFATTKTKSKKVQQAQSPAESFIGAILSDLENEYKEKNATTVTTSYRLEDRYTDYVNKPEYNNKEEGRVVIDVTVKRNGDVVKASLGNESTITDEETVEACKKAALKTDFNYQSEAPETQQGTITYTFTVKR